MRIPLSSIERQTKNKKYPYYGAATLLDYVENFIFDGIFLLFGEDGTVITEAGNPVLQYVWGKMWVNNHAHVFQGKCGYSTEFVYMLCSQMQVGDIVSGMAQPKISQGRLNAKQILIPDMSLAIAYSNMTGEIFKTIRYCTEKIKLLQETRDRLLPKLMCGEFNL